MSRCAVISAVPRAWATNVVGGSVHGVPGGRHMMTIGETPGSRTDGLLDFGAAGHGNISAVTSWPSATWMVWPFCAGVTITFPCPVLGGGDDTERGGVGVGGRDGSEDAGGEDDGTEPGLETTGDPAEEGDPDESVELAPPALSEELPELPLADCPAFT